MAEIRSKSKSLLTSAFFCVLITQKSSVAFIQNRAFNHFHCSHHSHQHIHVRPICFSSQQTLNDNYPKNDRIQSSMSSLELNQDHLRTLTLIRILIPSFIMAIVTYTVFPPIVHSLTEAIRTSFDGLAEPNLYGPATLNLILTDNSNQFIQNVHNFCGLLFSLLTAHTFGFLIKQQETLYAALFEELSTIQSLLEQVALVSEGRPKFYQTLLECVYDYLERDLIAAVNMATNTTSDSGLSDCQKIWEEWNRSLKDYDDVPALLISTRPMDDPLESILYLTSVGEPSHIYSTVRALRQARAKRLGALQQKMPDFQMSLLNVFGFMVLCTFPVIATGAQTVGGEGLIQVQRIHLSVAAFALGCVLGIIHELRRSGTGSAYTIDYSVLQNLLRGLHTELRTRWLKSKTDIETNINDSAAISINETELGRTSSSLDHRGGGGTRKKMIQSIWKKLKKISRRKENDPIHSVSN